ncbi:MAG: acetolactate decarboxylase [Syntrophorhabdaceae bacterium]
MMHGARIIILVFLAMTAAAGCFAGEDTLTQVSTIDALMSGIYDGPTTLAELREKGDFGLGTFQTLDGEMILLDGVFYQVASSGNVQRPENNLKTPFAAVTFFKADRGFKLARGTNFQVFSKTTESSFPSRNTFYAVKMTGTFETVKTRSVPAQKKPYRPLVDIVKTQPVFEMSGVSGTMVGFWCPSFVKGVNVPGYHIHFLRQDGKRGGHVLDFIARDVIVEIDDTREFFLMLPDDDPFNKANLEPDRTQDLKAVEK